jgi:ATP-dependent DNA helicase RecQ
MGAAFPSGRLLKFNFSLVSVATFSRPPAFPECRTIPVRTLPWSMAALMDQLDLARRFLRQHFGYDAFRPSQQRVIQSILSGHDTLGVLPTGGGKSICFQIPALVTGGLTLVVSPLISLMQDQVEALRRRNIAAAFLNSTLTPADARSVMQQVREGSLRLLYVSPERLALLTGELRQLQVRPSMLAVDEAHCISEWGHDFRPSYRELAKARYLLGNPPVIALTGSATPEVRDDIAQSLRLRHHRLILGSFDRSNLWFGVVPVADDPTRLTAMLQAIKSGSGMSIVYAPTRGQTELVTQVLREHGFRASPYHAGLGTEVRQRILHDFLGDQVDVIVATSAFGMGIDKPTVRLVVHWVMSPTMESYYQEAGRAGRDGGQSRCVVLYHRDDTSLARKQVESTFPPRRLLERIWRKEPTPGVAGTVQESAERLRRELRPEEGPVEWSRVDARRKKALWRLETMERYARASGCRRRIMLEYFGERPGPCTGCDRCGGTPADLAPPSRLRQLARRFHAVQI